MSYRKGDIPKVTIDRMKIGGKELTEEVANNILSGKFDLGIEKIAKDIVKRQDNAIAMEFTKCIGELLKKNGVVPKMTEYTRNFETENTFETRYGVSIGDLDFSEHDKAFEDKIARLESSYHRHRSKICDLENENYELKQRIAELESKETEKPTKINLNDRIKVKLTPLGAEIYYNRYDFLKSSIRAIGGVCTEPKMPKIDENGYTEMTMWQFIELYGKDIGKINREVIKPLDIIIAE